MKDDKSRHSSQNLGTKLVPVEPTEEMLKAGADWTEYQPEDDDGLAPNADMHCAKRVYQAMLSAAPSLPGGRVPGEEWGPIETAPKDGTRFLSARFGGPVGITFWLSASEKWWNGLSGRSHKDDQPTHWMPLPAPPVSNLLSGKDGGAQ